MSVTLIICYINSTLLAMLLFYGYPPLSALANIFLLDRESPREFVIESTLLTLFMLLFVLIRFIVFPQLRVSWSLSELLRKKPILLLFELDVPFNSCNVFLLLLLLAGVLYALFKLLLLLLLLVLLWLLLLKIEPITSWELLFKFWTLKLGLFLLLLLLVMGWLLLLLLLLVLFTLLPP